jgi:hypothetical protein
MVPMVRKPDFWLPASHMDITSSHRALLVIRDEYVLVR